MGQTFFWYGADILFLVWGRHFVVDMDRHFVFGMGQTFQLRGKHGLHQSDTKKRFLQSPVSLLPSVHS
jgi:hypothetical protein